MMRAALAAAPWAGCGASSGPRPGRNWTEWRPPALVLLRLPPDPTSATAIRAADPDWHEAVTTSFNPRALRDGVTRRPIV